MKYCWVYPNHPTTQGHVPPWGLGIPCLASCWAREEAARQVSLWDHGFVWTSWEKKKNPWPTSGELTLNYVKSTIVVGKSTNGPWSIAISGSPNATILPALRQANGFLTPLAIQARGAIMSSSRWSFGAKNPLFVQWMVGMMHKYPKMGESFRKHWPCCPVLWSTRPLKKQSCPLGHLSIVGSPSRKEVNCPSIICGFNYHTKKMSQS